MKRRLVRDEDVDFEGTWELGWWRREFRRLRKDPAFCAVITLTRAINMLRFVYGVVVSLPEEDTPETRRQGINAFLLASAVLVEIESLVNGLGKYFKDVPEYRDGLAVVIHSADFTKVVSRLRDLRKWSAFHFDEQAAQKVLQTLDRDFERFLSARGMLNKGYHYDMGDMVALGVICEPGESHEAVGAWLSEFMGLSATVTNRVLDAADNFVGSQVVARWKAVKRQVPEPPTPSPPPSSG
jgi:hypothetical protein